MTLLDEGGGSFASFPRASRFEAEARARQVVDGLLQDVAEDVLLLRL
jgi:hypothetical protein